MSPVRGVLFDLDGTLLDTAGDLVGALNHVRAHEGHPPVAVADYRQYVSQGALGLIRVGMPASGETVTEARRQRFLDHYQDHSQELTRPFDGVEEMLRALEQRAVPWAIVTNKPEYLTHPIIRFVGWERRIAGVVCGDTLPVRKPDAAPVERGCQLLGVRACDVLMVGDDARDMEAGLAAGTRTALMAYGYGTEAARVSGPRADHEFARPADLLPLTAG